MYSDLIRNKFHRVVVRIIACGRLAEIFGGIVIIVFWCFEHLIIVVIIIKDSLLVPILYDARLLIAIDSAATIKPLKGVAPTNTIQR